MTPDSYKLMQENNKKLYEIAIDNNEKQIYLARMMEAEVQFIENNTQIIVNSNMDGIPGEISLKPRMELNSDELLYIKTKKVTPQNILEMVEFKDENAKASNLEEAFAKNPKAVQALCDAMNGFLKKELQSRLGSAGGMQMLEDDERIGFQRSPESIKNPDIEVNNILKRAEKFTQNTVKPPLLSADSDKPGKGLDSLHDAVSGNVNRKLQ